MPSATGGNVSSGGSTASGGRTGSGGTSDTGGTIGTGGTSTTTGTEVGCGDGVVVEPEQCDLGLNNLRQPAFLVTQSGSPFAATPVVRTASVEGFYNYTSASAHTGLEELGTSRIMLFLDKSNLSLSLVFFHGIDSNTSGQSQPQSQVQMIFGGLPTTTAVAVSDDGGELTMTDSTNAKGSWGFTNNSDGGALSGLTLPGSWEIYVSPAFVGGISTWTWLQGDGSTMTLDLTQPITIKAFTQPAHCRADCTVPRCGDGILDGGELCDDGESLPGTGCSSDCLSLN
jgi:cysteine-rich repeat protein